MNMYIIFSNSLTTIIDVLKKKTCEVVSASPFAKFPESRAESVRYTDDAVNDVVVELILHGPGHSCHRLTKPHHIHIVVQFILPPPDMESVVLHSQSPANMSNFINWTYLYMYIYTCSFLNYRYSKM